MKKISVLVCIFLFSFITIFSQNEKVTTKTKKTTSPAKPEKTWWLSFELTIKGNGETKKGEEGNIEASWDIDRTYSGVIELNTSTPVSIAVNKGMSPDQIMAALNSAPVMWLHSGNGNAIDDEYMTVKVKINDKLRRKLNDPGEGGSFENTTILNYWKGNGYALAGNTVQLLLATNKNDTSYNVKIPLKLKVGQGGDLNLINSTYKTIERSAFGYGDAPTSEASVKYDTVALGTLKFPEVIGLLDHGTIEHPKKLPLKKIKGEYVFDSGDVEIDEPIFPDIPESQEGIKVRVFYVLKQMKPVGK